MVLLEESQHSPLLFLFNYVLVTVLFGFLPSSSASVHICFCFHDIIHQLASNLRLPMLLCTFAGVGTGFGSMRLLLPHPGYWGGSLFSEVYVVFWGGCFLWLAVYDLSESLSFSKDGSAITVSCDKSAFPCSLPSLLHRLYILYFSSSSRVAYSDAVPEVTLTPSKHLLRTFLLPISAKEKTTFIGYLSF